MKSIKYLIFVFFATVIFQSCFQDLDTVPIDKDILTSETFYLQDGAYKAVLAKIYAGLAVTGQQGPAGQGDLGGIDEGFSSYLRQYWYQQELSTDEAIVAWNDETIKDFHSQSWTPADVFINAFYNRVFYQIGVCNEFLRQSDADALDRREASDALKQEVAAYRIEARLMRAMSYWHALDEFRNVPFVTEDDEVGAFNPQQIKAPALFDYIESELLEIEPLIAGPQENEYGRADRAAVWMILAKLYLNAEVYIGSDRSADALTYSEKVINAGYTLDEEFSHLFLADNHLSNEVIFPIAFDGQNIQTWGGTTFIIRGGIGGDISPAASGVKDGWGGFRTTKEIVNLFGDIGGELIAYGDRINLPQVYIPGDYQGNEVGNTRYALSRQSGSTSNEGHQYFSESSTFVIAPNPTLSFVYGDNGQDGTLDIAGEALIVPEAGFYYLQADLQEKSYTIEKRQYSVAGSAVTSETNLEWDDELEVLSLNIDVVPGELYFRANGNDDVRFGDNDRNGILEYDGASIIITEAGPIKISLDLRKQDYIYQISSLSFDRRGIFGSEGQNIEIEDVATFRDGYAVLKFKNITRDGVAGSNLEHPDTDFPLFRLGDAYLMAAEAILRSNGSKSKAVEYFNIIRQRAYKSQLAYVTEQSLDLDMILAERARELMWEGHRRTDLVRFGQFTDGDYKWAWKGGIKEGQAVDAYRDIYPIPIKDINNNPNLEQNAGY